MKQSVVISNQYGTYELPHELPNDLSHKELPYKETL